MLMAFTIIAVGALDTLSTPNIPTTKTMKLTTGNIHSSHTSLPLTTNASIIMTSVLAVSYRSHQPTCQTPNEEASHLSLSRILSKAERRREDSHVPRAHTLH